MNSNQPTTGPFWLFKLRACLARVSAWVLAMVLLSVLCLELVGIVTRYWPQPAFFWASEVLPLALMSMGWIGAGHLWLQRDHLVVGSLANRSVVSHRRIWLLADAIMLVGVLWLLPQIRTTVIAYDSMFLPALEISASVKYYPIFLGTVFLGLAAALNLLDALLGIRCRKNIAGANH